MVQALRKMKLYQQAGEAPQISITGQLVSFLSLKLMLSFLPLILLKFTTDPDIINFHQRSDLRLAIESKPFSLNISWLNLV